MWSFPLLTLTVHGIVEKRRRRGGREERIENGRCGKWEENKNEEENFDTW